ncbi:hypothetical protein C5167_041872 [Papaver somniferum]|nr:hypothetical protein C5167_041872 [Papaver somniferum]
MVVLCRSCFFSGILISIQEITRNLRLNHGSFLLIKQKKGRKWNELRPRGTGVFDTWMKEPNMTTQINTFKQYIMGVYNQRDLDESMAVVALFGNDYTRYVLDGGTDETRIKKVVMLALQPLGCLPNKAIFVSFEKCDEPLNSETIFHNTLLQQIVQKLNSETTDSLFRMLDLYSSFMSVIEEGEGTTNTGSVEFGNPLLKPCCIPTSAEYLTMDPDNKIFWDLFHPTQFGWHAISTALRPSFDEI